MAKDRENMNLSGENPFGHIFKHERSTILTESNNTFVLDTSQEYNQFLDS